MLSAIFVITSLMSKLTAKSKYNDSVQKYFYTMT